MFKSLIMTYATLSVGSRALTLLRRYSSLTATSARQADAAAAAAEQAAIPRDC
jgi:hypothetical protein